MMTFGVQFAESFPTTLRYYCSLHWYETSPNCLIEWIERIEWVSEWVNEWASERASDRTNEQTKERTNERTNAFRAAVWTPIRYVTLYSRPRHGAASLRYRNRAEITVLMWEQKAYPVWFPCRRKSYLAY